MVSGPVFPFKEALIRYQCEPPNSGPGRYENAWPGSFRELTGAYLGETEGGKIKYWKAFVRLTREERGQSDIHVYDDGEAAWL